MHTLLYQITAFLAISFTLSGVSYGQSCVGGFNDSIDSLTVYITNTATGGYDVIDYDMGDGTYYTGIPNPTHTYTGEGFYEVCQFIYDTLTFMCFDYQCDTLVIGDPTCMANFWWFPDGLDVEFYANAFGTYDSLVWDFGDGSVSNDTFPIHTYSSVGTYTACLSLYDTSGSICDSVCYPIYVDSSSCSADFTYSANGLTVDFTNLSSGGYNSVSWDFGDGFGFSEDEDPQYTYLFAGTYEVCLFIIDTLTFQCFDEVCMEITVTAGGGGSGCEADFDYETSALFIECTDQSTGNYVTTIWDYGDGSTPTLDDFHTYDQPGTYDVCLTVGNLIPFCLDQTCKEVTVTEITCFPDFIYSYNPNTNVFNFANTTTQGDYDAVQWSFGDGNTSSFANPSYSYNIPGEYEVCLTTFKDSNLCGQACKMISVFPLGIDEAGVAGIRVFPNPSNGEFVLDRGNAQGVVQISLLDLAGRELARQVSNRKIVELNYHVSAGAYLLQVRDEFGGAQVVRVVVE